MCDFLAVYGEVARACECELSVASARTLTTFKGGGHAAVFVPRTEAQFVGVYLALCERGYEPYVLGGGSNTVIADGLLSTPIISTRRLLEVRAEGDRVYAQCGARLSAVTAELKRLGKGGLDFLCGVPATVGGAIRMNAGAFSRQTADYLCKMRVLNPNWRISGDECAISTVDIEGAGGFGYRQGADKIVLGALFKGDGISVQEANERARKYVAYRAERQPKLPSCGSVFKNGEIPSGRLIEECGLKGTRIGGAQISPMHANFIVNIGGASAGDFIALVELSERAVKGKYGITLEREFIYLENRK